MGKLKIYVADDHRLYRTALINFLLKEFKQERIVKGASNGRELLKMVNEDIPEIVILDLEMPVLDGTKACEQLVQNFPEVKIIVVSMHDSKLEIYHLLQIGAHAFLSKNAELEELSLAINALTQTGIFRNKVMQDALIYGISNGKNYIPKKHKLNFSERELHIVHLLCQEFTNKEISEKLALSENTIRNHKVRIMRKAGVKNVSGLVRFAMQNGLASGLKSI
jgi:two-component system, NarL family, response regulator DegU